MLYRKTEDGEERASKGGDGGEGDGGEEEDEEEGKEKEKGLLKVFPKLNFVDRESLF